MSTHVEIDIIQEVKEVTIEVSKAIQGDVGIQGPQGDQGPVGPPGNDGAVGPAGQDGDDGQGVPLGGTTGQKLVKSSDNDFDTIWVDETSSTTEQFVKDTNVSGTYNIDWSNSTYKLVLTGATVITESNLPSANTSKEISIDITGDFALTLPTDWTTKKVGDYDGTVRNLLVVAYQEADDYWTQITQPE